MTTPIRLRYTDSNSNQVVIGEMLRTSSSIDQATLKNPYETSYTNLVIKGDSSLFGSVPVDESNFESSEPEIFLDVRDQGSWVERDRVYAESGGSVDDKGTYKNKSFYGFGKYTGQEREKISTPITTNLEDAFNALLPSGYIVDYPTGATPPNVERYTWDGNRGKGYQELIRNYDHVFWFTPETDANGDYKVKLQPQGYGGQVDTFEKGVDPVFFVNWTKDDKLRRITEVEIIGNNSSDDIVRGTATTNPNNGRFIRRNVGYVETNTEAQNIAENILAGNDGGTPNKVEHGRVEAPLDTPPTNNLNASIQVINSAYNVDDLFTVSVQRDYFHESKAQYMFEFEQELTARQRQDSKFLEERNAELIDTQQTDVGQQGTSNVENDTAEADNTTSEDNQNPNVSGFADGRQVWVQQGTDSGTFSSSGFNNQVCSVSVDAETEYLAMDVRITRDFSTTNSLFLMIQLDGVGDARNIPFTIQDPTYDTELIAETFLIPVHSSVTADITLDVYLENSNSYSAAVDVYSYTQTHDHGAGTFTADNHLHNVLTTDNGHGAPGDPSEHLISGNTDSKNVDVGKKNQTDR